MEAALFGAVVLASGAVGLGLGAFLLTVVLDSVKESYTKKKDINFWSSTIFLIMALSFTQFAYWNQVKTIDSDDFDTVAQGIEISVLFYSLSIPCFLGFMFSCISLKF
jgi:hypothetical protein